jgi:two-component system, sensor histidine kinase RegB
VTPRPEIQAARINLGWLLKLRWVAVTGQLLATLTAKWLLGLPLPLPLPLPALFAVIGVTFVSNVAFSVWHQRAERIGEPILASVMAIDVVLLTALLFFTGGAYNPFSVLYFVHIALGAVFLTSSSVWGLLMLSLACYGFLYVAPSPSPRATDVQQILSGLIEANWVAFGLAASVIAYFVTRVQRALATRDAELAMARAGQARSEKLASLATLSAGAAHELSTPLSTIAVVAKELERALEREGATNELVEDTKLIREQVARCRTILDQMAAEAGHSTGELSAPISVRSLIELCLEGLDRRQEIAIDTASDVEEQHLHVPPKVLAQALRGIVKNALDASPPGEPVRLSVRSLDRAVSIEVQDRGMGMPPEVLHRVGEPFFTTKEPGRGMGLGVFLARAVAERIGGELRLDSQPDRGTTATVLVPMIEAEAKAEP